MTIYLITGNQGKAREFSALFGREVTPLSYDVEEKQHINPQIVIEHKIVQAYAQNHITEGAIIVDDTSLHLECMNELPGPLIHWFLHPDGKKNSDITKGLEFLVEVTKRFQNPKATAVCTIGYSEGGDTKYFTGKVEGRIVTPRGENGFGWDKIFQPNGRRGTYAELTQEEKNLISHRSIAIKELKKYLGIT